jgi:hypothetical protein
MAKKHVNADKMAKSQKAQLAAKRVSAQTDRGSKKFPGGSNPHHGASIGQSGKPKR